MSKRKRVAGEIPKNVYMGPLEATEVSVTRDSSDEMPAALGLRWWLREAADVDQPERRESYWESQVRAIRKYPQGFVERLVNEGVLKRNFGETSLPEHQNYLVVQPQPVHKHDWRWHPTLHRTVMCISCKQSAEPVWGTPEEWPNYDGPVSQ